MDSAKSTYRRRGPGKTVLLGVQHVLAMFGATVLVPTLTGLNPSLALICAGLGTLLFHLVTGRKVPVFLGSSFAFIAGLQAVIQNDPDNLPKAMGATICAGLLYLVLSLLVKIFGSDKVRSFFPPVVCGPIIIVIGLSVVPTVVTGALVDSGNPDAPLAGELWMRLVIAAAVVLTILLVGIFAKGFFKLVPILFGIIMGYLVTIVIQFACGIQFIDFSAIAQADWLYTFQDYRLPQFDISAILTIAPVALVTFIEHIGDITTNGAVVGRDFFKDPGLHRTLLGDGLATMAAGMLGGPPNTTYGENTGVLAVTKNYNPFNLEVAACVAILLGFFAKFGAVIRQLPGPVMGGVSIVLFGMIASIGIRLLGDNKVDLSENRNLFIVSVLMVVGLGINVMIPGTSVKISGLAIAAVVGVVLNKCLPEKLRNPIKEAEEAAKSE